MRVILARCWLCQVAVVSAGWCCGCNPKLRPFDDLAYADASRIADNPSARDAILASLALRNFRAHGKASGHIPSRYAVLCRSSSWSAAYEGLMIQEEKVYAFEWVSRRNKGMRSVEIHSAHDHLSMAQDLMDEAGAIRYLPNMVGGSPCILYLYDRGRVRADVAWCFSSDECLLLAQGTHWMWDGGLLAERISIPQGSAEAIEFGKWYIRFAELVGPDLWREQLLAVMRQVASDDPNYRLGSSDDWVMWPAMGIVAAPRLCGALHHQRAAVRGTWADRALCKGGRTGACRDDER